MWDSNLQPPDEEIPGRARKLVEAIKVHHLDPGRDKVLDKFRLRVRTSIDFRQSPELGV
jgi:hypothetical protein